MTPCELPGRLRHPGDLTAVRQGPQANAAHIKPTHICPRPATDAAAVYMAGRIFRLPPGAYDLRLLGQRAHLSLVIAWQKLTQHGTACRALSTARMPLRPSSPSSRS